MATVNHVSTQETVGATYFWEALGQGDVGEAIDLDFANVYPNLGMPFRGHQNGDFGGSAEVQWEASFDGTNWNQISVEDAITQSEGLIQIYIRQQGLYVRPAIVNGDGNTDIDVVFFVPNGTAQ